MCFLEIFHLYEKKNRLLYLKVYSHKLIRNYSKKTFLKYDLLYQIIINSQ